jgi:hypothetical protein
VISGLRRPIAIQAAISLNMNLPEAQVLANVSSMQATILHVYPAYDGMLHDELMVGHGPGHRIHFWVAGNRKVDPSGELDQSVIDRLKLPNVRNFIGYGPYRPKSLAEHPKVREFYA